MIGYVLRKLYECGHMGLGMFTLSPHNIDNISPVCPAQVTWSPVPVYTGSGSGCDHVVSDVVVNNKA